MSSSSEERSSSRKRSQERSRSREKERRAIEGRDKKVKIKIPDLSDYLYSFKKFSLLQTEKMSSQTIQKGYDKYKKDWQQRQNEEFMIASKNDAWFNEKYNPELLDLHEKQRKEASTKNYEEFVERLVKGFYNGLDLRVNDVHQIGTVYEQEEDQEVSQSFGSFLSNQTIEVVIENTVNVTKQPFFGFDPDHCTLFIKGLSKEISRYDIKAAIEAIPGWKTITMSDPLKKAGLTRNCWIQFHSQEQCQKALLLMNGIMIKNTAFNVSKAYTKLKRVKILKNYPSTRLQIDIQIMEKLIGKLDVQVGIQNNVILHKKYQTLQKKYDVFLLYLRRIHYFDFYTCTQFENERVLTIKVGSAFLRTEADYQELPNTQTVFKKIQENAEKKIQQIVEIPEYMVLLKDQMQKFIKESEKLSGDAVKQIWKCQFCDKKFKTCEFLAKHLIARHEDIKLKKIQTVMEQLYLKDPFKITNYNIRDESKMRKNFGGGFKRERRKETYRDFDEPEGETVKKTGNSKPMISFLDI